MTRPNEETLDRMSWFSISFLPNVSARRGVCVGVFGADPRQAQARACEPQAFVVEVYNTHSSTHTMVFPATG